MGKISNEDWKTEKYQVIDLQDPLIFHIVGVLKPVLDISGILRFIIRLISNDVAKLVSSKDKVSKLDPQVR